MRVAVPLPLLVWTAAALAVANAAGSCDPPFKTLSSDCRGNQYSRGTLCVVLDQRTDAPSPCKKGAVNDPSRQCAASTGLSCDVLAYAVQSETTQARFQIQFADDRRRLAVLERSSDGSGSETIDPPPLPVGSPTGSPPTGSPPPIPTAVEPNPTRVGAPTTRPPTSDPTLQPSPPRVDAPTTTPPPAGLPTIAPTDGSTTEPPLPVPEPAPTHVGAPVVVPPGVRPESPSAAGSESNEFVDTIGVLKLDPAITEVRITGGTSEFGTRGRAVTLHLDPLMLTQSPQVTSLWIHNCAIGEQLATGSVLSKMPVGLNDLILRNILLRTEPTDLSALKNLRTLRLEQNYLSTVSSQVSLPILGALFLSDNELTSFDGNFPELESLYLNDNKLDRIPDVVYSMSNLGELQLSSNPIAAVVVSKTQFAFLTSLFLKIDKPPLTPPSPVIYVRGPVDPSVSIDTAALVLDDPNIDLSSAVAVTVGKLTLLSGFPAWVLSDSEFAVFKAQQDAIAKSNLVLGGEALLSYQSTASSAASEFASVAGSGSRSTLDRVESIADASGTSQASKRSGSKGPHTPSSQDSQGSTTTSDPSHKTLIVSLVVVAVVAALAVALFVTRFRRRRNAKAMDNSATPTIATPRDGSSRSSYQLTGTGTAKSDHLSSLGSFGASAMAMQDAGVKDLFSSRRIRVTDVEDVRPIASGSTGLVWLVRFRGGRLLASKRLVQTRSPSHQRMDRFVNEVVIAAGLDHPSIIHLVGIAWTNETDLQALYEYMPNGDLQTHLYQNASPTSLPWLSTKLQMAIDIVEALVYTHSFSPPLLHRDLRAKNVLLDEAMKPKLSHFGSARFASEQNTMTTDGIGSGRWLAPEVLRGETDYDSPSDMYAFGVLLSELDTHAAPYDGACDAQGLTLGETALLELVVRGVLRPLFSTACPPPIQALAGRCLSQDPRARPSAMQVAYELRLLQGTAQRPTVDGV